MSRLPEWIQRHRHALLLGSLFVMILTQPVAHGFVGGLVLYDTILTLVLVAVTLVVFRGPRERGWALVFAAPAIVSRWAAYCVAAQSEHLVTLVHQAFVMTFVAFAVAMILRGVFSGEAITLDHLLGTVCGYILAGVACGSGYHITALVSHDAFKPLTDLGRESQGFHQQAYLFDSFSMSILTGAKYDDIAPQAPFVKTLAWMEALFGQFYLAVVVAQLVRKYGSPSRAKKPRDEQPLAKLPLRTSVPGSPPRDD